MNTSCPVRRCVGGSRRRREHVVERQAVALESSRNDNRTQSPCRFPLQGNDTNVIQVVHRAVPMSHSRLVAELLLAIAESSIMHRNKTNVVQHRGAVYALPASIAKCRWRGDMFGVHLFLRPSKEISSARFETTLVPLPRQNRATGYETSLERISVADFKLLRRVFSKSLSAFLRSPWRAIYSTRRYRTILRLRHTEPVNEPHFWILTAQPGPKVWDPRDEACV
jgi:hypothetical protein